MQLTEQYRPRTWSEVVGHTKAVNRIATLRRRGLGGRAYWIYGPSGSGKTTIARLVAAEIADPINIEEIDAGRLDYTRVQALDRTMRTLRIGDKPGAVWIINEAHVLTDRTIGELLTVLERLPQHVAFIFTTTTERHEWMQGGMDVKPLLSRCVKIELTDSPALRKAFARHARESGYSEAVVSYSGGKDSIAAIDLSLQVFGAVHPYYLYGFPECDFEKRWIERAERRFGVKFLWLPHPSLVRQLRHGIVGNVAMPMRREWGFSDAANYARLKSGARLLVGGHRMDESLHRRGMIKQHAGFDRKHEKVWPLWDWSRRDVFAYLRQRKLTGLVNSNEAPGMRGFSVRDPRTLRWILRNHPDDFAKLLKTFPKIEVILARDRQRPATVPPGISP